MEEQALDALIDQYLLGTISPGDKVHLEKLMADDPSVAGMVRDSKQAYKAIQMERHKRLRAKLRALDKQEFSEQRFTSGTLVRAAMILAILIITWSFLAVYFSPSCIARRHLIADPEAMHLGKSEGEWINAAEAFREHDYEKAIQLYVVLASVPDTTQQFLARWNILMAQLASEGPGTHWQIALDSFALEAPEPLAGRAKSISGILRSPAYSLFLSPLKQRFGTLKPRLI